MRCQGRENTKKPQADKEHNFLSACGGMYYLSRSKIACNTIGNGMNNLGEFLLVTFQ